FYPLHQGCEGVKSVRSITGPAMEHAWHHKETIEIRSFILSHFSTDGFVIIDPHHWVQSRIGPAEVSDHTTTPLFERGKIRICRIKDLFDHSDLRIFRIKIKRLPVDVFTGSR